jgi:hypothetical protein
MVDGWMGDDCSTTAFYERLDYIVSLSLKKGDGEGEFASAKATTTRAISKRVPWRISPGCWG